MRFEHHLRLFEFGAVAEFKRRSPSAGDLRANGDVSAVARVYEHAGASAMSVLVDERFGGTWDDLRAARRATKIPLLAKGFFSDVGDLRIASAAGADAALLLLRDLDDAQASSLMHAAESLGLDTLVEAHDAKEVDRAVALGAKVIGVNARDLSTFRIDRKAQLALLDRIPSDRVAVAESGIETRAQAAAAELAGATAVLVGSTLMRAPDPGVKLADLIARPLVKVCGLTRQEDVDAAVDAGADMLGFILAAESPRRADTVLNVPDTALSVAVFVGEQREHDADLVQFYAREDGHRARDAVLLRGNRPVAEVIDLPWEARDATHFERAREATGRVMLAGGLTPENVHEAIVEVEPWAVDSARSTERAPGIKDHDAIVSWIESARIDWAEEEAS